MQPHRVLQSEPGDLRGGRLRGREAVELLRIFLKMPDSDRYKNYRILNSFILLRYIRTHHIILCSMCTVSVGDTAQPSLWRNSMPSPMPETDV